MTFGFSAAQAAGRTPSSSTRADTQNIHRARVLADQGQTDQAVRVLKNSIDSEKDSLKRSLARMSLANILIAASRESEAEEQLAKALQDGLRISDYAYYHLGLIKQKSGRTKEAIADFERVIASDVPQATENETRLALARVLVKENQWKPALDHLTKLRKSFRGNSDYPEVLYHLIRAERKAGRAANSCKWARELWSNYPSHPLVHNWDATLASNTVDGEKLGCSSTKKELATRIRRLWLGGEADRAGKELALLGARPDRDDDEETQVDSLLANHLISEGQTDEALKLILRSYESRRSDPGYLMLLAKAASRAGEYQAAIAAYQRAYEVSPRGKSAATALFQAAFTSYQIQDYDGSSRRFEQFVKAFPSSSMTNDGKWYMAWMRFLRGDYVGAHESFVALSQPIKVVKKRGKRRIVTYRAVATDRLRYWSAMSLLKQGRNDEAVALFQGLVRDPAIGYYAVTSYYRLLSIPGAKLPKGVESRLGLKKSGETDAPTPEELKAAAESLEEGAAEFETAGAEGSDDGKEDGKDEDNSEEGPSVVGADSGEAEPAVAGLGASSVFDLPVGSLKDSSLWHRIDRARDLHLVGLEAAARRELREVEKRARTPSDRRLLMNEYVLVQNFDRSSYIGEIGFGTQRISGGLTGDSRQFWEYAYPRAYDAAVVQSSKSTTVPEELIWGIMRAESHFRSDAQSPVGALGLMQVMPFTGRQVASLLNWKGFEPISLLDPETNIRLGSRYLQRLSDKFSGSVPLVAAGYNAGPHRVHAWVRNFGTLEMDEFIEHIPFIETRNYVKRVVRNYQIYNLLYHGGSRSMSWLVHPVGIEMKDPVPTKEVW